MVSTALEFDDEGFERALRQAAESKIVAGGVRLSGAQLTQLLAAAPQRHDGTEAGEVEFADFRETVFTDTVSFDRVSFIGGAWFDRATFEGDVSFEQVSFSDFAAFGEAIFSGLARFDGAKFTGPTGFDRTVFVGDARFSEAVFSGEATFYSAIFRKHVWFNRATFHRDVEFNGSRFESATWFGPLLAHYGLSIDVAVFAERSSIMAIARSANFSGTEFRRGANVRLRWTEAVRLGDADFAEPSLLTVLPASLMSGLDVQSFHGVREPGTPEPAVVSLEEARVGNLRLSGVRLDECRFARSHGLDGLRLDRVEFSQPPDRFWGPVRWTRRQTIAEEHYWRARRGARGWVQRNELSPDHEELEAAELAALYRQLRKAREDSKDEPGANDFYYGEMEMRRKSASLAERSILWLYWLLSGYGLRASRALLALGFAIVFSAILLASWGFQPRVSYGRALLFAIDSSISLLHPAAAPRGQTMAGQIVEIVLRLVGPLLFGLALIALRGRVRR
jgi:uncharacterized protein YjbI with pentapeptide repeats